MRIPIVEGYPKKNSKFHAYNLMSIGCKNHICEIPIQQCAQKHVYSYKPLIKKMIPSENMIDSIAFDIN